MTPRVVVSDRKTVPIETIRSRLGADATVDSVTAHTRDAVIDAATDADALIVDDRTPLDASVIDALEDLRVIGRAGVGIDNVDVDAATENDVIVTRVPDYCVEEVATHALALFLASVRRLGSYDADVADGGWDWEVGAPIRRLSNCTVGIVAFGAIARRFADGLTGLGCEAVACDPYTGADVMARHGVVKVDFESLVDRADHLSIHAPLTDETRGLIDADVFGRLPEHGVVVNTGRGGIVVEADLVAALADGEIAGAGLDVLAEEPPDDSPLCSRDDVIVTPHAAWYAEESRTELAETVADDVASVLRGEEPDHRITPDRPWV